MYMLDVHVVVEQAHDHLLGPAYWISDISWSIAMQFLIPLFTDTALLCPVENKNKYFNLYSNNIVPRKIKMIIYDTKCALILGCLVRVGK